MWLFTVPLILIAIYTDSLMPPAVYACFNKFAIMLFASNVGAWLDQQPRSTSMLFFLPYLPCQVLNWSIAAQLLSMAASGNLLL